MKTDEFWAFAWERERIREKREMGLNPPFSDDPRLRDYWFPNLRRMDDPTTVWLHGALLGPLTEPPEIVLATVAFRLFGSQEAGEAMLPMFLGPGYHEAGLLAAVGPLKAPFNGHLSRHLRSGTLAAAAATCEAIEASDGLWHLLRGASLREAVRALRAVPGIGPELAYEIVCDLRWTPVLQDAPDKLSWALPSRSAVEAVGSLQERELRSTRRLDRQETVAAMRALLEEPQFDDWELSEVQRTLSLFHFWSRKAQPPRRYRWR